MGGGCPYCIESLQHVAHTGCTSELRRLREANMDEVESKVQGIIGIGSVDNLKWLEAMEPYKQVLEQYLLLRSS